MEGLLVLVGRLRRVIGGVGGRVDVGSCWLVGCQRVVVVCGYAGPLGWFS